MWWVAAGAAFFFGLGVGMAGFYTAPADVGAVDDKDCRGWPPPSGPHDEVENPNGCHEVCVEGHAWWKMGKKTWCYYDDAAVA